MKNLLLFLCLLCIVVPNSKINAEWKFQEFDTLKYNSLGYFSPYQVTFSKSNSKIAGYYENAIIEFDVDDLSKTTKLDAEINPKDNRQYDVSKIMYDQNNERYILLTDSKIIFLDKNNNLNYEYINDKYSNPIIYPSKEPQYQRAYRDVFIKDDTLFTLANTVNIVETYLYDGIKVSGIDSASFEIWSNVKGNFSLLESVQSTFNKLPKAFSLKQNKDDFLINSTVTNFDLMPLFEIKNHNINYFPQPEELSSCKIRDCSTSLIDNNTIYACYGSAEDSITKASFPAKFVEYENGKIKNMFYLPLGGSQMHNLSKIYKYKDKIIIVWGATILIGNNNYFEKLELPFQVYKSANQALLNEKGFFIFTKFPDGIVYNKNLEEIFSKTSITEEINSQEYFKIVNNSIEFLQSADQFSVFDLNGNQILSSDKVESTILLSNLSNGTYFISAQFGNKFISDKFLINK